ncbi:MAG: TonB-dependent receptor [Deltaproteobacteria bacterium]|nr:TonB-dependent receptor [Deltaproteobacteria bacterium]
MKKKNYILVCFFLSLFPLFYSNAQENILMDEITVTAARDKEAIHKIPAYITVITEEEIKKSSGTTIPDMLKRHAGIHFRSYSGNASQTQIDLRGFGGDNPFGKTLILLNGKRLNRPDMSSVNWLQIPIQQIQRIEVARGGASVLYGDSAVAGVINIITKKGNKNLKSELSLTVGDNNTHIEKAGITGAAKNFSFAANVQNYDTDGWRDRSAFSLIGGGLNISYDLDTVAASADVSYSKTEYQLPGSLTKAELAANPKQYGNPEDSATDESFNLDVSFEKITEQYGDIELKLVYNYNLITADMASYSSFNKNRINTFGILPKYVLDKKIFGFQNKFVTGIDIYNTTLSQNKYTDKKRTKKTHKVELEKKSLGWYFKNALNIKKDIILGFGFRTEKNSVKGKELELASYTQIFNGKTDHHSNLFDISITKLFGAKTKLFGKFSTLYRYPFLDEQVYYNGNNGDKFLTDLNPEKGESYEIGGAHSFFKKLNTKITLFNINMEDEIAYVGRFPNGENKNIGKTKHKGIEFYLSYDINEKFKFYSNWTYHKAVSENGNNQGKELPMVPNHKGNAAIEIKLPYNIYLTPEIEYTGSSYLLSDFDNNAEKLDSYTICGISLRYEPQDKNLTAFINIENIFDKKYSTVGSDMEQWGMENEFYPASGFGINAGVAISF